MELEIRKKIEILQLKIEDLRSRLPAHSIPPSMMVELDQLEDELEYWMTQFHIAEDPPSAFPSE